MYCTPNSYATARPLLAGQYKGLMIELLNSPADSEAVIMAVKAGKRQIAPRH